MARKAKPLQARTADVIHVDFKARKRRHGMTRAERFWDQVFKGQPDECWTYAGAHSKNGYGSFHDTNPLTGKKTMRRSNRVAMELKLGRPLKKGEKVLHSRECGTNRACCNPAHLRLGTREQNVADALAADRLRGRKLNANKASEIVTLKHEGRQNLWIAALYGVMEQAICDVVAGRTYGKFTQDLRAEKKPVYHRQSARSVSQAEAVA